MNKYGSNSTEILSNIKKGDIIFIIFICLSIAGIIANTYEKKYHLRQDANGNKKAHNIRMAVLTISLIIYIYFLYTRIRKKSKVESFLNNLDILASILFVIAGIVFLYTESKGDEEEIILE